MLGYTDIRDMVIKGSIKFLKEAEEKMEEIRNVISKISDDQIDILYEIILGVYESDSIEFLETLADKLNEDDEIQYSFNLLSLLVTKHNGCKDSVISKILIMLLENSDVSVGIKALSKLAEHKKINDNLSKRQIGDTLYTMFTKVEDILEKEKMYICIRQLEITNSFLKKGRKKREFTEEENRLIKRIDKNNAA